MHLIDDDPVVTFLMVDLVESVNLPYVVYESAVSFLEQDLDGLRVASSATCACPA